MDFAERQALRTRIRAMVEPTVELLGLELVAVQFGGGGDNLVMRLAIDKAGGVTVADCTSVSRALSPEFDVEDPIDGPWRLEVSSPGMDRLVQRDADFIRFIGLRAKVRMAPDWGRRRYNGELRGLSDDGAAIRVLVGDDEQLLPRDRVDRVHLDLTPDEYAALGHTAAASEGEPS
jgi:ribosome maturation factor RimP